MEWNRIEDPDLNPQTYEQLIFDKGVKTIQWKKEIEEDTRKWKDLPCS